MDEELEARLDEIDDRLTRLERKLIELLDADDG